MAGLGFEAQDIDYKAYSPCQTLCCLSLVHHWASQWPGTINMTQREWELMALSAQHLCPWEWPSFNEELPFFSKFARPLRNFHDSIFGWSLITLSSSARVGNLAELGQMACFPEHFGGGNENGDVFFLFQAEMGTGGTSELLVSCFPPCGSQKWGMSTWWEWKDWPEAKDLRRGRREEPRRSFHSLVPDVLQTECTLFPDFCKTFL